MHNRRSDQNYVFESLQPAEDTHHNLSEVPPGSVVVVKGYGDLPLTARHFLQSYGILPGRQVRVVSQRPVTIVQIEHTELAFEFSVAREILILNPENSPVN